MSRSQKLELRFPIKLTLPLAVGGVDLPARNQPNLTGVTSRQEQ
jgi:hypothetical protein